MAGNVLAEGAPAAEGRAAGCAGAAAADVVAAAEPGGDVRLASGNRVRLVDLRWPEPSASLPAGGGSRPDPSTWLATLAGEPVEVLAAGAADRWGRRPVLLRLPGGIDVAELLVGEGLAMVDAGERDALCRPDLLAVEAGARRRKVGLWATDAPVAAGDREAVRARADRFTVLEGRVVSVGERRDRTYLNFGRDFTQDLAVILPRRVWGALKASGRDAASLRGRLVRVRGTVEWRRGPVVEVAAADMVEVLEGAGRRP